MKRTRYSRPSPPSMRLCALQAVQGVTSLVQATISQSITDYTANYTTAAQLQQQTTRSSLVVRMLLCLPA